VPCFQWIRWSIEPAALWILRARRAEESPDSTRKRCRVTPGRSNPTESATENRPPERARVRVKRWSKSPPPRWQQGGHGKPHWEQCQIGTARQGNLAGPLGPSRFGLAARGVRAIWGQEEWSSRGSLRPLDRIRLIGPPRIFCSFVPLEAASFPCVRWG